MEIGLPQKQNRRRQQHQAKAIYQHMDEWKSAGRSGPVEMLGIHTYQGCYIIKGSKYQTGASILSRDKANYAMEKQRNHFSYKD